MRACGIEQKGKKKVRITLDNGQCLLLDKKDMLLYEIREDEEISEDIFEELLERQRRDCLAKSGMLLKDRDYPEGRLRSKLEEAGYDSEIVSSVIDSLKDAGYVDDSRFARDYVQYHLKDRSRLRILQDLLSRGISRETASQALNEYADCSEGEEMEREQILSLMKKRHFAPDEASYEEKQKMMAFLYGKGYSKDLIRRMM